MADGDFFARIWGARGSLPVAGGNCSGFGSNTPCIEVRCGPHVLVFDAGSGIFPLGQLLVTEGCSQADILFSHCHYDHIEGLPFFRPLMSPQWRVGIWSGHQSGRMSTAEMVEGYMRGPYFPVGPSCFLAATTCHDFTPGEMIEPGDDIAIRTARLNHPGGAVGYRVDYGGRAICYVTDTEHLPGKPDKAVLSLIAGADAVIYDSAYDDKEFETYRGYGHSTWQEGARLCDAAGVDLFVAFHHQPENDDRALEALDMVIRETRPNSRVAREGMVIVPGRAP